MDDNLINKYQCNVCGLIFDIYKTYWKHMKRKTPCISQDQCKDIVEQSNEAKNRVEYYQEKTTQQQQFLQQKESEIETLKRLVERLSEKEELIKETQVMLSDKMDLIHESVEDSKQQFHSLSNKQLVTQQINNYNFDNKTLFNISFSHAKNERLDHITKDMLLEILDHENLNDSLKDLTASIYFHPKCPENWKWNVSDLHAKCGALEFNFESGTIIRKDTREVIEKNMKNVWFSVTDLLEELRMSRNLNRPQAINCSKLINMVGTDFSPDQINSMKESAYEGREFPRALWNRLKIKVEVTKVGGKKTGLAAIKQV